MENYDRYMHIMEYYSAMKMKKLLIHATTWFNLKCIMLLKKPDSRRYILYNSIYMIF